MNRAVLYARYSSDMQSPSSIADQLRALREALPRLGLVEVAAYDDAAISGSNWQRPGLNAALAAIEEGRADVLLAEDQDRISRDLEHVAHIAKRIWFRDARIVTLFQGQISLIHIGLSGTMAQMFLEQLAEKTRRGLRGVVADGRVPTKPSYGYRQTGNAGVFAVDPDQAEVVQRILRAYAHGTSPRAIAHTLNEEGIPGPKGGPWKASTILGDRIAATGIINNRLYVGEIIWNRSTWRKNPTTGQRQAFQRPPEEWVIQPAPEYRIVDDNLWQAVRERQGELAQRGSVKRPTRPLSGLVVCGCCGTRMTILGRDRYGCPRHKETGLCDNGRSAPAAEIERRVLDGLRTHLCHPETVDAYAAAYVAERKRLRATSDQQERRLRQELAEAEREQKAIMDLLGKAPAAAAEAMLAKLGTLGERVIALRAEIETIPGSDRVVELHRVSTEHLARNLMDLWEQLLAGADAGQARMALNRLISRVVVHPLNERGKFSIDIEGDVAAFLDLAGPDDFKKLLVAGAGFEPAAFRL